MAALERTDRRMSICYLDMLKMLLFCHRHTKTDAFLLNSPVTYEIVRDPMYLYSQRSQDKFFEQAEFAFLFAFFARNEHARNFCLEKFNKDGDADHTTRMVEEIKFLEDQAIDHLRNSNHVLKEAFLAYLGV